MDLQEQIAQLETTWRQAFDAAKGSPASWQPYLPNASLVIVDEAVGTLKNWASRVKVPTGFGPAFHLAQSVAVTSVPSLTAAAQQLAAGNYAQLPNFVNGLIALLGAMHTMAVFSDKRGTDYSRAPGDLAAMLSQSLALLDTAQAELKRKADQLDGVENLAGEIAEVHASIDGTKEKAESALKEIGKLKEEAAEAVADATTSASETESLRAQVKALVEENEKVQRTLTALVAQADAAQKRTLEEQALVASLLPRAASAGLAAAFAARAGATEVSKWVWMGVFVLTLAGLGWFARELLGIEIGTKELVPFLLLRITLAAPLIWLAWFAAVQYGNIVRVQEDYAFKEATSKAFQGYRDHMEHLARIGSDEGANAMNKLALATIEILAREPLRIYKGTHHDASPMNTAASLLARLRGRRDDEGSSKVDG